MILLIDREELKTTKHEEPLTSYRMTWRPQAEDSETLEQLIP